MIHSSDAPPYPRELRVRHLFTMLTAITTVALLAWGAFVTSINAGLAVPDWPSSFNSYDPFNPWPEWWTLTPVLAEHGHRLLGALVGILTLILAVWTLIADDRRWMKALGVSALILVSVQGTLGGLRVVLLSLDLAVVHACVAQIYFGMIVGLALFTSRRWTAAQKQPNEPVAGRPQASRLRQLSVIAAGVIYVQIILGALLRHPGTGIDPTLVGLHFTGALATTVAVVFLFRFSRRHFRDNRIVYPAVGILLGLLILQFTLGVTAYVVTLNDSGFVEPSNLQVVVNTSHMVTGALLMGAAVAAALGAFGVRGVRSAERHVQTEKSLILDEPAA